MTKRRKSASGHTPSSPCSAEDLYAALRESVQLQSHYARLLNQYDGGNRHPFATTEEWIARLRKTGGLPNRQT